MSRSGYSDDCENVQLWRGAVRSAIRGKRGQKFLREMLDALDAMPDKRLITDDLVNDGEVCAIGSVGIARSLRMDDLDPLYPHMIARRFGIAEALVQEIEYVNDEAGRKADSPYSRWCRVRAWVSAQIKEPKP